ncbi:MAG: SpoIIIAH-like family protein [Lachnospiraceae bacterium]|nr:SpoIIIAH-like family protein [Lachnospiraceae bacterium]
MTLKRNQIMITALALMIAIAGYLNFAGNQMEDELAVAGVTDTEEEDITALLDLSEEDIASDIISLDSEAEESGNYLDDTLTLTDTISNVTIDTASAALEDEDILGSEDVLDGSVPGEAVYTSTQAVSSLAGVKLIKEQTRAKNKETLLEIINSTSLSESQKQDAVNSMMELTQVAEKEMAAEILLESKGFDGAVVSVNGNMADVVVCTDALDDAKLAQIEDIVVRKTGIEPANIIISAMTE